MTRLHCSLHVVSALLVTVTIAQSQNNGPHVLTFHGDRQRVGWNTSETVLAPSAVASSSFGPIWNSPQFDSVSLGGQSYPPHVYASPLYVDSVSVSTGANAGRTLPLVFAATSNGYAYAVSASTTSGVAAGTVVWRLKLTTASVVGNLDGGMPMGVMGTPIIDLSKSPPRMYVASDDAANGWQVFAIDITSGQVLPGWPLSINNSTLAPINRNGPTTFQPAAAMSQRGALNLSPDGTLLYVPFGAYGDGGAGWMVAVSTVGPSLASAFAGAPSNVAFANGGMWASGGPAVDANGRVYVTTGNGTTANTNTPGYWGQSVLVWNPGLPLSLAGTYTPWNYCQMDGADIDLAGGAPVVLPDLSGTGTPHLLAFGGKQGNEYLLDRDNLPGNLVGRLPCSTVSTTDRSLLPPGPQPQFNARGPLNVFGPYSDTLANVDYAKGRSTPAFFRAADGTNYIYVTGSTKANAASTTTVPPCIVKLKIVTAAVAPAYLSVAASENTLGFLSPGSPVITSNGSLNPIVWVLVGNVLRSDSLLNANTSHPILYALDPNDLHPLFVSTPAQLNVGGKYNTPAIARGMVFVGTDRIQAFGIGQIITPPPPAAISINSGGAAAGNFLADNYFTGGNATAFSNAVDTTGVVNPAPQAVYQTKRTGGNGLGFSYAIPGLTAGGSYLVRLHFCESLWTAAGQRLFNVAINSAPVLANFDIFHAAGGQFKAVVEQFPVTANTSGQIVIAYTSGSVGNALSSGIELISPTAAASGISINAGGGAAGKFVVDTGVVGGHSDSFSSTVDLSGATNPAPLAVYQSKRTGASGVGFTYTVPYLTLGHPYTVRLHFADDLSIASGQRLFNVAINGVTMLNSFDIFAAAGKPLKAVIEQFPVLPNASGQIQVSFSYGAFGNPLLSGIEVNP